MTRWTPWSRLAAGPAALRVAIVLALLVGAGLGVILVAQIGGASRFWSGVGR